MSAWILQQLTREQKLIDAGSAAACGFTCTCHGGYRCARAEHPNHGEHWTGADGTVWLPGDPNVAADATRMPEDRQPHIGPDGEGGWVQWCGPHTTPGSGPAGGNGPAGPAPDPPRGQH